jgi:hypothetical protein
VNPIPSVFVSIEKPSLTVTLALPYLSTSPVSRIDLPIVLPSTTSDSDTASAFSSQSYQPASRRLLSTTSDSLLTFFSLHCSSSFGSFCLNAKTSLPLDFSAFSLQNFSLPAGTLLPDVYTFNLDAIYGSSSLTSFTTVNILSPLPVLPFLWPLTSLSLRAYQNNLVSPSSSFRFTAVLTVGEPGNCDNDRLTGMHRPMFSLSSSPIDLVPFSSVFMFASSASCSISYLITINGKSRQLLPLGQSLTLVVTAAIPGSNVSFAASALLSVCT